MTHLIVRHRRWVYLAYALGMLSVPFAVGYVDDVGIIQALLLALIALSIAAYAEMFAAAERGSLNYRKMTGNTDLLILADTHPAHTAKHVWDALTGQFRWLTLAALVIGRFAVALALSHYLHIYIPSSALRIFAYVSHNGYYLHWWPVWGQMALALAVLTAFALAESGLMIALATLIYTRVRRRTQWRLMMVMGGRLALGMGGVLGVILLFYAMSAALDLGEYPQARDYPTYICYNFKGYYDDTSGRLSAGLCREIALKHQLRRVGETAQIALFSQLDSGLMTAASLMRPQQTVRFRGEGLAYRPQYVNPNINNFSYQTTYWMISPWWLIIRMGFAAIFGVLILRGLTRLLWRGARYD